MSITSVLSDPDYARLKQFVLEHTGLHYYAEKDEDLAARVARRLAARGSRDCAEYIRLLSADHSRGGEWDSLIGEITIGETYFFRQIEHFNLLRATIIPELLARKKATRQLRIWSAGCATGAEPYSVSLLLRLNFREELKDWYVSVLATDINVDFLARARTGKFGEWALREIPEEIRRCCFRQEGRMWTLNPEYRDNVRFEYHNLASDAPYPGSADEPLDLILCRNVMIYFSHERIRNVGQRFYESLDEGGWLLIGHAEPSTANFPQYEIVSNPHVTAYRRRLEGLPAQSQAIVYAPWTDARPAPKPTPVPEPVRIPSLPPAHVPEIADTGSMDDARALADEGDLSAAANICRRLLEADSLNAAAHFMLGLVVTQTGSLMEAEASLRRAIYLDRSFALAHYHLGVLLQAKGSAMQARKAFANVVDLLQSVSDDEVLTHGDGINAAELGELAEMHLEAMKRQ